MILKPKKNSSFVAHDTIGKCYISYSTKIQLITADVRRIYCGFEFRNKTKFIETCKELKESLEPFDGVIGRHRFVF